MVIGGESTQSDQFEHETWLYQLRGSATLKIGDGEPLLIGENSCMVVPCGAAYTMERSAGSIGLAVKQDPTGNR